MMQPYARWCGLIALNLLAQGGIACAGDPATAARDAATAALQQLGSADGIRQHASLPLTDGSTPIATIDGTKSAAAPISNPSSSAFLSVSISSMASRDLRPVQVSQDLNFDGVFDSSYQPPFPVSGVCANGVVSCDAGTWNHCQPYLWQADNSGRVSLTLTTINTLAGCYCVNQSCGGGAGNLQGMLKDLGGAVVGVVQGQKSAASITRVDLTNATISYYGQDNSGSPTGTVAQSAYATHPAAMTADAAAEAATQAGDPDSTYSMVNTSFTQKETTAGSGDFAVASSAAANRVDAITSSMDSNTLAGTTFNYTDTRQDQKTGAWTSDAQTVEIQEIEPPPDCEFACKTKKAVQDSQVAASGVSTDYHLSATRYDTLYHVCNGGVCPAGPGEVIVEDCRCIDEFTEAATAMAVLDEAGRDTGCTGGTTSAGDCIGAIKIFNGKSKECLQNGWSTSFFNCCNDSFGGSFLIFKKRCPAASVETVQARQAGRAHFIGTYCKRKVWLIGCVQKADVYCVFNSKMGRIIHEQGRLQLERYAPGGSWGSATSPNCAGFTPEEFQMLDFSRIDLSEMFADLAPLATATVRDNAERAINAVEGKVR